MISCYRMSGWQVVFTLSIFRLAAINAENTNSNEKLTIQRQGYGVNFDNVGIVVDAGSVALFTQVWMLDIPHYQPVVLPPIPCTGYGQFKPLCVTLNSIITTTNLQNYEKIVQANSYLNRALGIVPLSTYEEIVLDDYASLKNNTDDTLNYNNNTRRRRRRQTLGLDDLDDVGDDILDFDDDPLEDILKYIPSRVTGQIFADLFNIPGAKAIQTLKNSVRSVGRGLQQISGGIRLLNQNMARVMDTVDKRLENIVSLGGQVNDRVTATQVRIRDAFNTASIAVQNVTLQLYILNQIKSMILTELLPTIFSAIGATDRSVRLTSLWTSGVVNLASGYLSKSIIPENMIDNMVTHITQNVLSLPIYNLLTIISENPAFYYKLKGITYARTAERLIISIDVPLIQQSSRMTIYRTFVYPVPVKAGMNPTNSDLHDSGYTKVSGVSDYIAIAENSNFYIEMSTASYLACKGVLSDIKMCGHAVAVTKHRAVNDMTCAFAIYIDDHPSVSKECSFGYTKTTPIGSARQIMSDGTFLIFGGNINQNWRISCISTVKPIITMNPCDMCRVTIPCGCTFTASTFFIGRRLNGCQFRNHFEIPSVTTIYHRNMVTLKEFADPGAWQNVQSYDAKIGSYFPGYEVPTIEFAVVDNVAEYVEKGREYAANYSAIAALTLAQSKIFATKVDSSLAKVRDFSDQIIRQPLDVSLAFSGLIDNLFGGEMWSLFTFVFSEIFLCFLSFVLSLLLCIPTFLNNRRANRRDKVLRDITHPDNSSTEKLLPAHPEVDQPPPYTEKPTIVQRLMNNRAY